MFVLHFINVKITVFGVALFVYLIKIYLPTAWIFLRKTCLLQGKGKKYGSIHLLIMFNCLTVGYFFIFLFFILILFNFGICLLPEATNRNRDLHVMAGSGCSGLEGDCQGLRALSQKHKAPDGAGDLSGPSAFPKSSCHCRFLHIALGSISHTSNLSLFKIQLYHTSLMDEKSLEEMPTVQLLMSPVFLPLPFRLGIHQAISLQTC